MQACYLQLLMPADAPTPFRLSQLMCIDPASEWAAGAALSLLSKIKVQEESSNYLLLS